MSLTLDALRRAYAIRNHARAARSTIVAFRDSQIRKLVQHAFRTVLYYRALWHERVERTLSILNPKSVVRVTTGSSGERWSRSSSSRIRSA